MIACNLTGILGGVALLLTLICAAPTFDDFSEPLDRMRWFIGVPQPPKKGWLHLPKGGWIVSRGLPDDRIRRLEVVFRGELAVAFHTAREPLSGAQGPVLRVGRGKGARTLVVTRAGAEVDGLALAWEGALRGTFRLYAAKGAVDLDEVRVAPRTAEPPALDELERNTVHFATTPPIVTEGDHAYSRVTLTLWDVEVCFLLRRGEPAFKSLRAPVRGAPVLGALVSAGDARALALKASAHPLAMRDWGDERRNLSRGAFLKYVGSEYAMFAVMQDAQRALNAAVPERKDLAPLVHLAVIRHSPNASAATALAETQGAKKALAALRKALGKAGDRVTGDQLRAAAGVAAKEILGAPPPQWPGFQFDPVGRFVTIEQAKDLLR
jgi:hypothetical protein